MMEYSSISNAIELYRLDYTSSYSLCAISSFIMVNIIGKVWPFNDQYGISIGIMYQVEWNA